MRQLRSVMWIAVAGLTTLVAGCDDDETETTRTNQQLVASLLTIDDVAYIPADWEENTREVVAAPVPPFDGTLDPYLCVEAGIPQAVLEPQAQLELTGGSVMEVLLASPEAEALYDELDAAYKACGAGTSLVYTTLDGVPAVGDESASYRSDLGIVTIARAGTYLMILKWWVGDYFDQTIDLYPQMVTTAAERLTDL